MRTPEVVLTWIIVVCAKCRRIDNYYIMFEKSLEWCSFNIYVFAIFKLEDLTIHHSKYDICMIELFSPVNYFLNYITFYSIPTNS